MNSRITVILGSVREARLGVRVANLVLNHLKGMGLSPTLIDPLELNVPMMSQPLHFMKDPSSAPQWMLDTQKIIRDTDGFIIISPEYNATLPPALTNLLDHFPPKDYRHKPVSIATYSMGSMGGARSTIAMRPFLSELGMVSLPSTVQIPAIQNALKEDGTTAEDRILKNVDKLCTEIVWYATAIKDKSAGVGYPN